MQNIQLVKILRRLLQILAHYQSVSDVGFKTEIESLLKEFEG